MCAHTFTLNNCGDVIRCLLVLVPRSHGGNGLDDQGLQDLLVHISELSNIEAALAGRVLAELCEQRLDCFTRSLVAKNELRRIAWHRPLRSSLSGEHFPIGSV